MEHQRTRNHHSKTRSGCLTCKSRRVKCDETKPTCKRCAKAHRICEGYKPPAEWIFYSSAESHQLAADDTDPPDQQQCHPMQAAGDNVLQGSEFGNSNPYYGSNLLVSKGMSAAYVDKIISHTNACTWPQLLSMFPDDIATNIRHGWAHVITTSPMLFNANIHSLGRHFRYRITNRMSEEDERQHMLHQSKALKMISKELDQLIKTGGPPNDLLIVAVLVLASYNPRPGVSHGQIESVESDDADQVTLTKHEQAMRCLVERKGGLDMIETPGIAHMIFLYNLVTSTVHLRRPWYFLFETSPLLTDAYAKASLKDSKWTFDLQTTGILARTRLLLELVQAWGPHEASNHIIFSDMAKARMEMQWRILSLPFSAIRTALLILSDFIIFPLPGFVDVRRKLSTTLKPELIQFSKDNEDTQFMLWLTVLGGIASCGPLRFWFVRRAAALCSQQKLMSMSKVEEVLSSFAWSKQRFNRPPATAFWTELFSMLHKQIPAEVAEQFSTDSSAEHSKSGQMLVTWAREYVLVC